MPNVGIALVSYNGGDILKNCLTSITEQNLGDAEVLLLDNGSSDGSADLLTEWSARHESRLTRCSSNTGFAAAYNHLIRQSTAEYILVLNQDVILGPKYVQTLVGVMDAERQCASASGVLLRDAKTIDAFGLVLYRSHRVVEGLRGTQLHDMPQVNQAVFGVPATAALYRRSALNQVAIVDRGEPQYFDELFFAYKEDVDLAYRLAVAGWGSSVAVNARAMHRRSVRGENAPRGAFGGIRMLQNYQTKPARLNELSYRNHLYFLVGTARLSSIRTVVLTFLYESAKVLILAMTNRRALRAWKEVAAQRHVLFKKRRAAHVKPGVHLFSVTTKHV